jgi:Ubiquitin-activating enzyme E1 FCCH domain
MAEYSRIARGRFVSTGGAQIVNLPFKPDRVRMLNYTVANSAAASQNVASAEWDEYMGQGFAVQQGYNATPALIYDTVIANGISTFSAGQLLQFGPTLVVSTITKASPAVVTTGSNHGLTSGDVVIFEGLFETSTTGMPQINGIPFTVTVTGATTFTIPWNTNQSNYTAISGASTGTPRVKKVLYPYLYFPGTAFISAITLGTTTTIDTTDAHNFVVGQEVAFRIPSSSAHNWGTVQLNSLPNTLVPGSPVYGYVIAVTDYNTIIVNIDSSAYTAFNSNPTVASVPGLSYPQIVAVGDVNTGGVQISAGSDLYPPPYSSPIGTTRVNTINGPAIQGAFVNNTSQGFIIGVGAGTVLTTSVLVGAVGNVIIWQAFLHDYSSP